MSQQEPPVEPMMMDPPELPPILPEDDMESLPLDNTPRTHRSISELLALIHSADALSDSSLRDAALLEALRTIRKELEIAQHEKDQAKDRLLDAREAFDMAANMLAGALPAGDDVDADAMANAHHSYGKASVRETRQRLIPRNYEDSHEDPVPENPIVMPQTYTSGGGATEEMVTAHREAFYKQLLGIPLSQVDDYVPNEKQPNLRSKAQLVESMHIVENWYTGADGMDVGTFRSKHKTWYTRMKPNSTNLGRRTGIHVRALAPPDPSSERPHYEGGETVLCRYNKDGTKSIVYLDVGKVFDALFEIHAIENDHKGRDVVKAKVDERYANIPDGQVKIFIETCPICIARKAEESKISTWESDRALD